MEVLRVPPYPLTTTWDLPIPNYEYIVYVEDLVDHSVEETNIFSDANGKLIYELPLSKVQFDRDFLIRFYDTEHEHILDESNLTITRPYVNPLEMGTTASEINEYKMYELIARSIIDTYVGDGFYNHKLVINTSGNGADYFPIWHDANKVLKVYENNILVYDIDSPEDYDYEYGILLDNSAIYRTEIAYANEERNRTENNLTKIATAHGDLGYVAYVPTDFPKGYDYTFILDVGYRAVPADVEVATKLLIEDIRCGKLDYYKRYITNYNTDQFRIQIDKSMNSGTGNMMVDRILDKYVKLITKPGVL
jgi:hypothetical protein